MEKGAHISDCGSYRYNLYRCWDRSKPFMTFVMLNPSTADANEDDPTIRRCMGFAEREDCGGIEVVNLFAYRATDPKQMKSVIDPIGPMNNDYLSAAALDDNKYIVCAWGAHGSHRGRDKEVLKLLDIGNMIRHLGLTKAGQPKHPLYLKSDTPLQEF